MLLDTSGILCSLSPREKQHSKAALLLRNAESRIVTHNYVLAELVALAMSRRCPRSYVTAFTLSIMSSPVVELIWVDEPLHREAIQLVTDRPDKGYSLCDAVSFVLMKRYGISEALTTDKHFEQEGFVKLL